MNHGLFSLPAEVLLRGALLLPLCFIAALFLRHRSASLMRRFWRYALVALVTASALSLAPPILTFETGTNLSPAVSSVGTAPTSAKPLDNEFVPGSPSAPLEHVLGMEIEDQHSTAKDTGWASPTDSHQTSSLVPGWPSALGIVWLAGALVLLLRKMAGDFKARRLTRSSSPVEDPAWNAELRKLVNRCGLKQPVELRSHLALRSPIVTGIWRPFIILPTDHMSYSPEDRRSVLLHELAHVVHRDGLFRWITAAACILHWPNPLVWYAERFLRLAEERSSDDAVLNDGIAAHNYAEFLTRLAKGGTPMIDEQASSNATAMAQPSGLLPRIHAILKPTQSRRQPGLLTSFALMSSGIAAAFLLGSSAFMQAQEQGPDSDGSPEPPRLSAGTPSRKLADKLHSMIIPEVRFDQATLEEALEYIRVQSIALDPEKKGINIVSRVPKTTTDPTAPVAAPGTTPRPLNLKLEDIPVAALLDFINRATATSYRVTDYALVISSNQGNLESRNYRIPAKVFERELTRGPEYWNHGAVDDPFAPAPVIPENETRMMQVLDWLREQGMEFPQGSSAFYIKGAGTLNVTSVPHQLDFIDQIIASLNQSPTRQGMRKAEAARLASLKKTLIETIIPAVDFQDASLEEALDYVRAISKKEGQPNPVQFIYELPVGGNPEPAINLKLNSVPVGVVLKHIVDLAGCRSTVGAYGIEITPRRDAQEDLRQATFQLSAENLQKIHDSIISPPPSFPISQTLRYMGIEFPPDAAAFWNSANGDLIVRNTSANLARIETLLQGLAPEPEPN